MIKSDRSGASEKNVGVCGFKGSGFKVPFLSLDFIWNAYLREKRQLRQAQSKFEASLAIIWENGH